MLQNLMIRLIGALLLAVALPALADPPARVGRISHVSGQVDFRTDKDDEWTPAALNYPVTSHNGFATSSGSRLEIRVGSAAIRVDEDSEIAIPRLDDDVISINVKRGVANVTVRSRESRYPIEVLAPAGKVTLNGTGSYRIEADHDADQTVVTAYQGSALLDTEGSQVAVSEGRELVVTGIAPLEYTLRGARRGPFEDWVFARDARNEGSQSVRYVSPEVTGYEDLDEYGDWRETPEYGAIWVPRVTVSGWAPYRYGRWAWVAPWGWTWVDYAPWGFAPFHYGRWVYFNDHWGWAPGIIASRPVYAPALVAFVGSPGWNASFSFGSAPAVGWVPLGYRDIYRPGYPCSPTYVRNVNVTNINVRSVNVTNINWSNPPTPDYSLRKYPHAVTVVPQNTFGNGKPVINQAAKLAGPVNEPVIGTAPRVAAPVRRVVAADAPGQPRPITAPAQSVVPHIGNQPAPENSQRRLGGGPDPRTVTEGGDNSGRAQPRIRADAVSPGGAVRAQPPAGNTHDGGNQTRRMQHREDGGQPVPRAEQPAQRLEQPAPARVRQIERPPVDRPVAQREAFDASRRQPHVVPAPQESRREASPAPEPAPRAATRGSSQGADEGRGAGRRRAE